MADKKPLWDLNPLQHFCPHCNNDDANISRFRDEDRYFCLGCHREISGDLMREHYRKRMEPAPEHHITITFKGRVEEISHTDGRATLCLFVPNSELASLIDNWRGAATALEHQLEHQLIRERTS